MTTEYGKRVKAARKHAGLTQKQLAPLVGMSQSNLSELETVAHESGKTVQIAKACGVSPYWLAIGEGEMLPSSAHRAEERTAPLYQPRSLVDALPVVLESLSNLPAGRWSMVKARLDDLIGHPEMRDDVATDILPLLQASAGPISKRLAA